MYKKKTGREKTKTKIFWKGGKFLVKSEINVLYHFLKFGVKNVL